MKKILVLALALTGVTAFSQETGVVKTEPTAENAGKENWNIKGQNTLTLNQASFSNWIGGGANNIGWIAGTNYNLTYKKGKNLWENIVILGYGENNTQNIGTRKTQDIINLSSNYGRKVSKNWYVSAGASLMTQFAPGYDNGNDPSANKISNFMAPGFVNVGAGMTYKPNDNFTATIRPANARWTFVMDEDLQKKGLYGLKNDGDTSLFQFGLSATASYKLDLMKNISLMNSASLFSNYLDHPERLILGYSGVLNMKVNDYISSIITLDLVYDHNQIQKTQVKQTLGVGLSYNIDNTKK